MAIQTTPSNALRRARSNGLSPAPLQCLPVEIRHLERVIFFGYVLSWHFCSSSQLRRVRLVSCNDISDGGLSEAAAKLPLLEELELSLCSLSKDPLVAVGHCCPLLKSLKLFHGRYRLPFIVFYDEEVLAIAENMPELRHLQLVGNKLTNDGLQAILDGCPHLESLDLRKCYNVTLSGNLGRRCTEGIKNLRLPNDSTDDYEHDCELSDFESVDEDYPLDYDDFTNYHEYYDSSEHSESADYGYLYGGHFFY